MNSLLAGFVGLVLSAPSVAEPLLEGRVRLESGEPVAAAQVRLFDMTDLERGAVGHTTTDGTGYFALSLSALPGMALPERFELGANYPNPFNPSTIIPYQLAALSQVRLEVFNLLGQRIATLVDGERLAGFHTAAWNATDGAGRAVGAGVYIYRMTVGAASQTGRMVLVDGQAGIPAGGAASVMPGAAGGDESSEGVQVYGLLVSGEGLVPYVDSAFRVEAGMAPVELVVSSGPYSAGKVTDADCPLCDFFDALNDMAEEEEEEEEETTEEEEDETGEGYLIVSASVSNSIPTPGQAFTLRARVQNQGTDAFQDLVLSYYRSSDATISTQDMLLGTDEVGSLAASSTSEDESINLTAPSTSGTYYYGACVASVSDEGDTPTYCSTGVRVIVADEDDPVAIPDAKLRAAIAKALGKASGATITKDDMTRLTTLDALNPGVSDLTGLEFATNLEYLDLSNTAISDLSPLSGLTNLEYLSLSNTATAISDLSPLSGLTNLEYLSLSNTAISDLSPLSGLTKLTRLWLYYNAISDLSPLSGLTKLKILGLAGTAISDLSPLSGLTKLEYLFLEANEISDLSPLSGLTKLTLLYLGGNEISDISPLSGLTKLTELLLSYNEISDLSPLRGLTNLEYLFLNETAISDLSPLRGLTKLTLLGLGGNEISDISPLLGLTRLTDLNLNDNPLSASSINDHIPFIQIRGATVFFSDPMPVITTENLVEQYDGVAQHDDQVVVMSIPGRLTTDPIDFDALAQVFFAHYEDAFDYLMVFSNLADIRDNQHYEYYGSHLSVQNTVQGTGRGLFSRNPEVGSAGRLNAILHFPYNEALLWGPSLHEIMHSWANYRIPTVVGSHWGFSSANGQLGGFDRANLIDHGGGRYSAEVFGTFANGGNSLPYSPIELYFAGLIPPSEVPDLWVAEDGEWSDESDDASGAPIFTASQVSTWSIERIMAEHGVRIPNSRQSQKHFRAALILLIDSAHPAQQGTLDELSAAVQQFTHTGRDDDDVFNFWEATGGRATLAMDGLSAYRRSGRASKPVVSYRIVEPVSNQDGHIGCVPMDNAAEASKWMVAPSERGKW